MVSAVFCACQKEEVISQSMSDDGKYVLSQPLVFSSSEELARMINLGGREETKAFPDFVSYEETVMQESDYYDRPNAILSSAFGRVLNSLGEVFFSDKMLKVGKQGILVGPQSDSAAIRVLADNESTLSLCGERGTCPYVSNSGTVYPLHGYPGVYFADTFNRLKDCQMSATAQTKAGSVYVQIFGESATSLFHISSPNADWGESFVVPPANQQKVYFSDNKHCNDTKIYQQNYIVTSGDGIITKTMKKGLFFTKVTAPIEADFMNIVIHETVSYVSTFSGMDINMVYYQGGSYVVLTKYALGTTPQTMTNATLLNEIAAANSYARSLGYNNIEVQGIRYIINDQEAITRLADRVVMRVDKKIDVGLPLKFGGQCVTGNSLINSSNDYGGAEMYYIWGIVAVGCSNMNDDLRGSQMIYTYLPVNQ